MLNSDRFSFFGTNVRVRRRNYTEQDPDYGSSSCVRYQYECQCAGAGRAARRTGSALKAKAASPAPSDAAKNKSQKTTIGKGNARAKAPAPSSYWTEEVDVHDDGSAETTEFLYDAQRGIVYAYGEDDFTCANGKPEKAGILEAVYATDNKAGRPVGSGYYVVGLNAGQCAAKRAGAYGCKFDADANPTEGGAIAVNDTTGEVTVVTVN